MNCKHDIMYTRISRGPGKIAASSRRGPPRQVDFKTYESRDKDLKESQILDNSLEMSSHPKPTFQHRRSFNKKMTPPPAANNHSDPSLLENHHDVTKLLTLQWKKVEDGLRKSKNQEDPLWEAYREKDQDKNLEDFQPFDLETLWYRYSKNSRGRPS